MEIKENEQDSGLHARQALMKQRFIYRNTESQQQKPLYKEDEISLSASEISERELQIQDNTYNLKYENTRDKMKFQNNFQQETSSPHSLVFFSNCQIDLTMQENQHKSMENKFKFRHGNEESIQNSQLAFHNSNYQLNKERQFYENSIVENTSEGKNKKNSINSSKPYQGKTQPQEGENANSQDSKMNQKQQEEPHINPIQNKTLKHMIHQNKVNNIKKKFINNLITSCPSVTFKHLTRKQFGIINDFSSDFGYFIHNTNQLIFSEYIDIPQKLQELETKLQISQTKLNWIKLIKLECLVLLIAHVACCIFLRIGLTEMRLNNDSWITQFKYDDNSNEKNYIISLYYIIITMTTIGYGDITPFTTIAIVATNICAYSYTQINEIVKYEEQKKQIYQQTMQGINNEMNKMGLNILLQHKVRKHFEFQLYKEEEKKKYSENLFDVLPKSLKEEVLQELTQGLSNEIIVLKNMSTSCLKEVRNSIKQKVLFPEEIIVKHNELDNCIYYVAQGSVTLSIPVQVLSNEKYHKTPFMNVKTLTKNTAFGYEGFLLDQVSPYTIKSDGVGFLLLIQKDEFLSILKRHPRDYEMYMMLKDEALLNKKTENIIQNCMSCNDSNHQIGSCPYVTFFKKRWKKPIKQEVIRQTFNRQRKDRTKSNSYKNLIIYQDCAKEFVLTQQRDEEINELYNLLKSNKQATQKDFVSSETTNSSESDMTEQLEEDSSSFANFVNSQKLTVSLQNNLMQNQQQQKSNQFISTEQRGIQEQLKMKSKRESFEIKKGNSSDNTKNMNTTNGVQGVQSRQLYVIEEGEEDTIQQSMNRSLDSYNKIKKSIQESIFQRQNEEKQFEKNSSKQNENTSSNSSIFPPSSNEKVTQRNVDYQDLNIAPAQIYSNTSILNDIPDKNKVNSAQIIEDNSQNVSKTSINVSTSLQQARQNNNQQKKSTAQSPSKIENSKKRSSQTSIKDLNKFEMTSKHLTEEQWDIEDENNNMKLSGKKQVQANKEQTFQDEMFNIYQKNAKKALRSERRVSSLINKELESPYKFSTVSNLLFDDFTSPVLISPTKRKNKYTQSIIIQNLEHIENNPVFLHNQSSTSQSQFDSECIIQQTPSNQQISLQGNLISTSPLVLQKRSSQKMLSNQVKFSQNIQSHQPGNTTPRNSLPTNSAYPQQIDQQFDIQIPSKNRDQRARQSFSQAVQNDQAKYQPQSTSPKNSESKMNLMNMSMSEYKQQTLQNLNYASSQGKMQTHLMLSSGESHQYSSEYQIKFQEGLQDLDMLIVRKNLRIAYEKGFIKTDLVKVLDNEIDIDIMKNYNFYYPQKNARVVVFKLRRFQQVANSKKSKIVSKINIENKKKIRKSKQSEYSSLSVKNLSTKPNSATMNQLSRPSLRIS